MILYVYLYGIFFLIVYYFVVVDDQVFFYFIQQNQFFAISIISEFVVIDFYIGIVIIYSEGKVFVIFKG